MDIPRTRARLSESLLAVGISLSRVITTGEEKDRTEDSGDHM